MALLSRASKRGCGMIARVLIGVTLGLGVCGQAAAQQNSYGGHDIVAFPGAEAYYAATRGWTVFSARSGTGFAYCFAEGLRDGAPYRLGWDGMQWQLAVPIVSRPDWQGTLQIDGAGSGQGYRRGGDAISGTTAGNWTIAWLGEAELDGLRKGSVAVLGPGRADFDVSLSGSTAAILKVQECVARAGAAPAAALASEPSERVAVPFERAGDWTVNTLQAGGRVLACEAVDTVQPSLRFEIDRDNSYIDFSDNGPMGGPGAQVSVQISFGPGIDPQTHPVQIIEGADGRAWGRLTEGRMDGPGLLDDLFQNAPQVSFQGPGIILERGLWGSKASLDALFRCSNGLG